MPSAPSRYAILLKNFCIVSISLEYVLHKDVDCGFRDVFVSHIPMPSFFSAKSGRESKSK